MKCLETRKQPNGTTRRRYRTEDGLIVWTVEVPEAVWNFLNKQGRGNDRLAANLRARARVEKRTEALRMIEDGWKAIAVSHELGVSVRTIERWRAASKPED